MASILYRVYLLISAVTPAFIYSLVGAILVFLFSLRMDANMVWSIVIFFSALGFSSVVRILKDIWSHWPYAYHSHKFNVAEDEIPVLEARPLKTNIVHEPYKTILFFAVITAVISGVSAYFLSEWIVDGHHWLLWVLGSLIVPVFLSLSVLVVADNFFRAYCKYEGEPKPIQANQYLNKFFIIPEVTSFLILNIAIIWPLNTVQNESHDVAWVTVLVMSFISSSILLLNAKATPINLMSGALFSKLWEIQGIDEKSVDVNSPRQYQTWQFSYKKWLFLLVLSLTGIATAFMASGLKEWFLPFLICAEVIWVAVYLHLRIKVLKSTLAKVVVFYRNNNSYYQAGQFSDERQLPAELAL